MIQFLIISVIVKKNKKIKIFFNLYHFFEAQKINTKLLKDEGNTFTEKPLFSFLKLN